ncbi:hypothetical protein [Bartonella machadoae]|uniref:hypothetical protein n=1 Tax=Bartonella machadoae TaxID=2893471 RepID=UPI001F4C8C23|nr:hypothetical protein [Bartonella machadoae]UNE55249.1 hypothetical protein LNM86_05360 [Bartonella machadoae]
MNTSIDFLCDLWMALSQFSNHQGIGDKDCKALVEAMDIVEKALILKLQDESPNALRILAMITNFGSLKPPSIMEPLLKAYAPSLKNSVKKAA